MTGYDGAAERIARLSALSAGGYFDVNRRPDTPSSPGMSPGPESVGTERGGESPLNSLGAALEENKRRSRMNGGTDSPASSQTTQSAIDQRNEARFVDGMTYDEGVVDTTNRTPQIVAAERMDMDSPRRS
jgi:hypothetical protein